MSFTCCPALAVHSADGKHPMLSESNLCHWVNFVNNILHSIYFRLVNIYSKYTYKPALKINGKIVK